jgi:hypothetical protein
MHTTRSTVLAIGLTAMCAAGLAQAQDTKTTTTTKVEITGGKDVVMIGCLSQENDGDYILSNARENPRMDPALYVLVTTEDLSGYVGERVEVHGMAVMDGKGTLTVESKTRTEVENRRDQETTTKSEGPSGTREMPYLGVSSMKTLSPSCA